jgi:hypothetical protein
MRPRNTLAVAAACGLLLCLAARQSSATVVRDRGKGVANPPVETGGHRVPAGTRPPSVGIMLIDTGWSNSLGACPWGFSGDLFGSWPLPLHDRLARRLLLPPRAGFIKRPEKSAR